MNKIIIMTILSSLLTLINCKSKEEKFFEEHKVIHYNTEEAKEFINNAKIKPDQAKKIQANFAFKNNKNPEAYSFFIIDNYYAFTSQILPKRPKASVSGIWVNATTGEAKYVKENIELNSSLPYLEKGEKYPF